MAARLVAARVVSMSEVYDLTAREMQVLWTALHERDSNELGPLASLTGALSGPRSGYTAKGAPAPRVTEL